MDCWHHEIDRAATEADVVRSAGDYLFLWAPHELAPLSLGWRDLSIETPDDIERVKQWLIDGVASAHSIAPRAAALRELASYFWYAAERIREIRRSRLRLVSATEFPASAMLH